MAVGCPVHFDPSLHLFDTERVVQQTKGDSELYALDRRQSKEWHRRLMPRVLLCSDLYLTKLFLAPQ